VIQTLIHSEIHSPSPIPDYILLSIQNCGYIKRDKEREKMDWAVDLYFSAFVSSFPVSVFEGK
jgi:hypothetical protein